MYDTSHQPEAMQARYKLLPPDIIELFEYGTVEFVVEETVKEFGLNEDQRALLLMEIELILYFFYTRKGLVERLKDSLEIDQVRATQIAAKLESDLFIIVDDFLDAIEKEFEAEDIEMPITVDNQPETVSSVDVTVTPPTTPPVPATSTPQTETPAASTPLTAVKPMRTYSDDVNMSRAHSYGAFKPEGDDGDPDEPTHSSNQSDLLGSR